MEKIRILGVALVIILSLAVLEAYALFETSNDLSTLSEENRVLKSSYNQLQDSYNNLNSTCNQLTYLYQNLHQNYSILEEYYHNLTVIYSLLNNTHNELSQSYSLLETSFNTLDLSYANLNLNYAQLNASYNELEQNYTNLGAEYENLKSAYESLNTTTYAAYVSSYQELRSKVNFYVLHPKEEDMHLITPDDQAVKDKVQEITDGWSDPSDWNEYWADVKAIYEWVVNEIEYRSDGLYPILPSDPNSSLVLLEEMWQFPNQTLMLKKGDCEDMAVLLASMIYCYSNKQYWVECIVITDHAAVYIPVEEDKICILDPAGRYYTNTGAPSHSITAKDVDEEVHGWLNYWDTNYPKDAPHTVKWIFSTYIYKYFDDTTAFINWLYDRL